MTDRVIVVHLRKPRRTDPADMRRDPFWEFGSFGLTGCHAQNLMHPGKISELTGARLAFVQGGSEEMRLVLLTSRITVKVHRNMAEACWSPKRMPFKFSHAPVVINNAGDAISPRLLRMLLRVERPTWVSKFSSMFRTRRTPLEGLIARDVIRAYEKAVEYASREAFATRYEEALPYLPPKIDRERKHTYGELLKKASGKH